MWSPELLLLLLLELLLIEHAGDCTFCLWNLGAKQNGCGVLFNHHMPVVLLL